MNFFLVLVAIVIAIVSSLTASPSRNGRILTMSTDPKKVLLIGGTRFSGLYLWKELHQRGHHVTLFNRGKTALKRLPKESEMDFEKRKKDTSYFTGNRQIAEDLQKLASEKFDVIYDMNGREASDTAPLADIFNGKVDHFIYMSSAGVYKKSTLMPHSEVMMSTA